MTDLTRPARGSETAVFCFRTGTVSNLILNSIAKNTMRQNTPIISLSCLGQTMFSAVNQTGKWTKHGKLKFIRT